MALFQELYNIQEDVEEERMGMASEFFLHVEWLPGARIGKGNAQFEEHVSGDVRAIIADMLARHPDMERVNIGRVVETQMLREKMGGKRRVYVAVSKCAADPDERISYLRLKKWGVEEYLQDGITRAESERISSEYRDYILDRIKAVQMLGIPMPSSHVVTCKQRLADGTEEESEFFERPYIKGIATDKIPLAYYGDERFVLRYVSLLGKAAARNLVVGRAHEATGHVFFDDGDEVLRLSPEGEPEEIVVADMTGSFADCRRPLEEAMSFYKEHARALRKKMREQGLPEEKVQQAVSSYVQAFREELTRIEEFVREQGEGFCDCFRFREGKEGDICGRWCLAVNRARDCDPERLAAILKAAMQPSGEGQSYT